MDRSWRRSCEATWRPTRGRKRKGGKGKGAVGRRVLGGSRGHATRQPEAPAVFLREK